VGDAALELLDLLVIHALGARDVSLLVSFLTTHVEDGKLSGDLGFGQLGRLVLGDVYVKYHRSQGYYDSADWRGTIAYDGGGALMNQGDCYYRLQYYEQALTAWVDLLNRFPAAT